MLRNKKWSSWCVCVWNHSSVSGIQLLTRIFPRRKCRWWKKEKNKWQEWSLPSSLQSMNWVRPFPHRPLCGTLCSPPHKLLLHGCCSSFPWWHQEPLFNSQGMTAPTWTMIPVGDTLCHHWWFMDEGKKRPLQSWGVPEYWTLSLGVPKPGAQWLKCTELLAGCSCSTVLWNEWYLGGGLGAAAIPLPTCTETSVHLSDSENPAASKIQELSAGLLWSCILPCPVHAWLCFSFQSW